MFSKFTIGKCVLNREAFLSYKSTYKELTNKLHNLISDCHCASSNERKWKEAVYLNIINKCFEQYCYLIELFGVEFVCEGGYSLLFKAYYYGYFKISRYLINQGARFDFLYNSNPFGYGYNKLGYNLLDIYLDSKNINNNRTYFKQNKNIIDCNIFNSNNTIRDKRLEVSYICN